MCRGCQTQEDCGHCRICLRFPRPGLKRQWRCLQRRCFWVSQAEGTGDGGAKARPELILLLNSSPALLLLPASLAFLPHVLFSFLPHVRLLGSAHLPFSASTLLIASEATLKDASSALPTLWFLPLSVPYCTLRDHSVRAFCAPWGPVSTGATRP